MIPVHYPNSRECSDPQLFALDLVGGSAPKSLRLDDDLENAVVTTDSPMPVLPTPPPDGESNDRAPVAQAT